MKRLVVCVLLLSIMLSGCASNRTNIMNAIVLDDVEGADGYKGKDHYHRYNPNATGKGDYYLDVNDNPVPKNSAASHIIPED